MNTFKRNLLIGYSISLVLLVISSVASFISIKNLLNSTGMLRQTNEMIRSLDQVAMASKDGEAGQRGFLLTGDERFLAPYSTAFESGIAAIEKLRENKPDTLERSINSLEDIFKKRFEVMQLVIDRRNSTGVVDEALLEKGRQMMQQLRTQLALLEQKENELLTARTENLNRFANLTPVLIVVAALLSFIITIVSFLRVNSDFEKREKMQRQLEEKEESLARRIEIIQNLADKIAAGNYSIRVDDAGKDVLGNLGNSLNIMAESLQNSFENLSDKEWLQSGIAGLNEKMIGEKNLHNLTYNVIEYVTEYTKTGMGAFYINKDGQTLELSASILLDGSKLDKTIRIGDGISGQAAQSGKPLLVDKMPQTNAVVSFAAGTYKPVAVLAAPVFYEGKLKGVIELDSIEPIRPVVQEFLKAVVFNVGMALHSANDHERLQNLLEETQTQAEELQSQHSELENINAELEAQAEKLQASEEELKVQQEELQQANQELEERSRLLEEKNELILERNLEIQAKAEALELSTKYKSEFLANMSHELRTPLNSILLLSRLLSENHEANLTADQVEYAKVIQNSGNGLLTLIDEILDLSKIESGKMDLDFADVAVSDVVKGLKELFEPVSKDKNIDFNVNIDGSADRVLETDRLRLEQILRNLLSNALKFTKKGSVSLAVSATDGAISFAVTDTGIGIPKEKQQSIFEAFQQADGSTRRKYGGTGLGLSISRELAKLLGGEITLQSEEGKGSTFTLVVPILKGETIPAKKVEIPAVAAPVYEEAKPQPAVEWDKKYTTHVIPAAVPDDRSLIKASDKVLLIIEDDTAFARSLLDFARQKGYKGIVAVRGDEGIELAKQYKPLGILLDIQLPIKNGWEVMESLKSDPATRPIPVHMMSSHQERTKSISKGAIDFINKPMAFEKMNEIIQKIEQALSKHPKKVLIVEENPKHAKALAYFLETFNVAAEIKNTINDGMQALNNHEVDCVILDMGVPAQHSYNTLEEVKKTPGFENLPIIIFTGKNLSHQEEMRIKQYADSIVIKTAHSYQRILDEVSLFLHLVEENKNNDNQPRYKRLGALAEVLRGKTVLIADDDVRNIFSLTKALETYGMNVLSAIDGKDAIRQLEEAPRVDIVLMDMMMPEMDGYESTRRIRNMHRFKNLPVIAVTAKAMTGDREKCINAGASDYITKPVDVDQLISLLRVWLYDKV